MNHETFTNQVVALVLAVRSGDDLARQVLADFLEDDGVDAERMRGGNDYELLAAIGRAGMDVSGLLPWLSPREMVRWVKKRLPEANVFAAEKSLVFAPPERYAVGWMGGAKTLCGHGLKRKKSWVLTKDKTWLLWEKKCWKPRVLQVENSESNCSAPSRWGILWPDSPSPT
jgi:hypothetical protein